MAFLDNTGLSHLWGKIKTALSGKLDTTGNAYRAASIPFAQVDGTSTSTVFTATVPGITELRSGVCVFLMNGVVTSVSGFTININELGAKPVYSTLAAASRSTTLFNINYTLFLVYNEERVAGGCWDAYYGYDSNTNTIGYQLRTTATTMPTLDKFYRYRLLFTAADRHHFVPANTSSSTSADTAKTTTQRPIDPFGAIYYYGHTTAISANANPTTSYFWTQYNITLGYSFNRSGAALALTSHAPVYIKCAPQSDGSAIIDADTPFVQTLPSTEDGKIYIFLGVASSATAVELVPEHPVFCYRNRQICLWTGNIDSGITVDSEISSTSENPVQNKVVAAALEENAEKTTLLNLLIPILRQGLYGTDQEAAISALETALGGTPPVRTFIITNNLTNVTNSNEATAVNSGASYTATLTPAEGMELSEASVTMGGSDITSTAYSNGAISITSVTGNIVITAVAESVIETYTPTLTAGYFAER